jgi:hypothetical protein
MKGVKHGSGELLMPNGELFRGVFKNDVRHGQGLSVNLNTGIIYRGEYREGEMNGHGVLYCQPGEIIEANFTNGKIADGKIKVLYQNGEYYEGDFRG